MLQHSASRRHSEVSVPNVSRAAELLWASEVQRIEEMSLEEEKKREEVAQEIEFMLLYDFKACSEWRVKVFGSSKSRFGSLDSDLDMFISTSLPKLDHCWPAEVLGFYYLKRLMEQKVWEDDGVLVTTRERVEQFKKARPQILEAINKLYSSEDPKQRQVAPFFDSHMRLLIEALDDELDQLDLNARSRLGGISNSQYVRNELLHVSKRRKNDLFNLKSMLANSSSCRIDAVASHARIPVLRFRYMRRGLEYKCDLCFDNELGLRNTRLLRAYACFDDRARELGLAVKYWAKQRGITATSSGFLSSYSFVLLSIYFLQIVHVLPNLQNPQLLERAGVFPEFYDGESVVFCEDQDIAQIYHQETTPDNDSVGASLPALLLGFFQFYATEFDSINHVVTIRSPEKALLKTDLWGNKAKNWRMSTQDPLQTACDVGGVLYFSAQRKFTHELGCLLEARVAGATACQGQGERTGLPYWQWMLLQPL